MYCNFCVCDCKRVNLLVSPAFSLLRFDDGLTTSFHRIRMIAQRKSLSVRIFLCTEVSLFPDHVHAVNDFVLALLFLTLPAV